MNISTSKNAALVFSNGEIIRGFGIGKPNNTTIGEICFNTAITGYQEILTDPSYSGQIINFTFPHIGNVGVNDDDIESQIPKVKGLIIRETITNSGNYRAKGHLND
ncbi:MAG: carbamoyl-phosphate synthase small subunit, partial [Rickettsiales bacterium]